MTNAVTDESSDEEDNIDICAFVSTQENVSCWQYGGHRREGKNKLLELVKASVQSGYLYSLYSN